MTMKKVIGGGLGTAATTVLAPISWGTTYVAITEFLPAGRPLLVATMRVVPAGAVLLVAGAAASRWRGDHAVAGPVVHAVEREAARVRGDQGRGRKAPTAERGREVLVLVRDRPVDGVEERARVGVNGRVPQPDARRVVDRDLPCKPEAVRSRLPAQLGRDGCGGDAAAGDESLRGSGAPAEDVQPGRVGEVQPCGRGLHRIAD